MNLLSMHTPSRLVAVALIFLAGCASAPAVPTAARAELAPSGKLRVGLILSNQVLVTKDPTSGELRGVTITLGKALAQRMGVPFEAVAYANPAALVKSFGSGEWDIAFLAFDPARAKEIDFSPPYMEVDNTYLVTGNSRIASVEAADQAGVTIAVPEKSAPDLFLSRNLKSARILRLPGGADAAVQALSSGKADAYAENAHMLSLYGDRLPGSLVLEGSYTVIQHAVATPKGKAAAAEYLKGFVEDSKADGTITEAIRAAGLRRARVAAGDASATAARSAHAQQPADDRVADLVLAGKLRVGIGLGSPSGAMKDPATGELHGLAVDLGRALATRIGVEFVAVEYPRPGAILEGVRTHAWDVAFLVVDPARTTEVEFAPPHLQSDFTYLVPAGSSIHSVADADQPGIRIAVPRGDGVDLRLTRLLKRAELVRTESIAAAVELIRTGGADARAGPRQAVVAESVGLPGSRVLADGFAVIFSAALVPKGHAGRLAYVSDFIEQAKLSGSMKAMIEGAGLQGVQVAPAGKPGAHAAP